MEIVIDINNDKKSYKINEDIQFEKLESNGYFYVPETEKIIVMNDSSLVLWETIVDFSKHDRIVSFNDLKMIYSKIFDLQAVDEQLLKFDLAHGIESFVQEGFLKLLDNGK